MIITLKSGFLLSLKKARKVPFLTEEDYENAVFNSKTKSDASSRFFNKAKHFLNVKNERFGDFCPEYCQKLRTEHGASCGHVFCFLKRPCVFFRFLSLTG